MTKYFVCLFFLIAKSSLQAETPAIYIDGRIVFSTVTVGGVPVWSAEEQAAVENLHRIRGKDTTLVFYTPDDFEVAVATSGLKFSGYSDFRNCVGNKNYLDDKVLDMSPSQRKKYKVSLDNLLIENAKR